MAYHVSYALCKLRGTPHHFCVKCFVNSQRFVFKWYTHTFLSMKIMQKTLPKLQTSLITLQELCTLVASHFCDFSLTPKSSQRQVHITPDTAKFSQDSLFTSLKPNFFMMLIVMSSKSLGLIHHLCSYRFSCI